MLFGLFTQDLIAVALLGVMANFIFSFLFGWYLIQNIGKETMQETRGRKQQGWLSGLSLALPFAKMALTLYRVVVLQLYFLNRGYSYQDYWIYLTQDKSEQL
ncbi:hypothetical protein [Sulfurimonas diazotrophicus]|uniref:Uncharacterized protein n=1 Tax=Sulfurimonas diazotrophicus TaxID=3131939 RepID=A0ABZ3HDE8_9BACT